MPTPEGSLSLADFVASFARSMAVADDNEPVYIYMNQGGVETYLLVKGISTTVSHGEGGSKVSVCIDAGEVASVG